MNRLYILACLASVVAGKCSTRPNSSSGGVYWGFRPGHSGGRADQGIISSGDRSVEIFVAEIARKLIDVNRKMHRFCKTHSDRALREVYGVQRFQIRVTLIGFSEDDIEVRVWQRLVLIHVQGCSMEYASVRVLPNVVDPGRAMWKFQAGELTVLFPYLVTPDTQIQSRCSREVSEDVIVVPKCTSDQVLAPDYDLSFGKGRLKEAMKRYMKELANEESSDESVLYYDDEID